MCPQDDSPRHPERRPGQLVRRRTLLGGAAGLATAGVLARRSPAEAVPTVRLAIIADLHHDVMHDAPARLEAFLAQAKEWKADAVMEMGDFCVPKPANRPLADRFESFPGPRFHILGNHDMDEGHKREEVVAFHKMPGRYYAFDLKGIHGIVLDGNDRPADHKSGYPSFIAQDQIDWLRADLERATTPVFVFSHQSLERPNCIRSQAEVRAVIEAAKRPDGTRKVAACLNGHFHLDHARDINGIPYIHVNSASYYWVGSEFARDRYGSEIDNSHPNIRSTAPYREPLFTLLEIDLTKKKFSLTGRDSSWVGPSPQEIGRKYEGIDASWVAPRQSPRQGTFS